jgi:hypothetical protein
VIIELLFGWHSLIFYREVELLPKFERIATFKRPCSPLQIQITFLACIVTRIAMLLKEYLDVCRRLLGSVAGRTRCGENNEGRPLSFHVQLVFTGCKDHASLFATVSGYRCTGILTAKIRIFLSLAAGHCFIVKH